MDAALKIQILAFLEKKEIKAYAAGDNLIAINRNSMCQSEFSAGYNEEESYTRVIYAIETEFKLDNLAWMLRNDDDYFLGQKNQHI